MILYTVTCQALNPKNPLDTVIGHYLLFKTAEAQALEFVPHFVGLERRGNSWCTPLGRAVIIITETIVSDAVIVD